jgi:hypothetical protein
MATPIFNPMQVQTLRPAGTPAPINPAPVPAAPRMNAAAQQFDQWRNRPPVPVQQTGNMGVNPRFMSQVPAQNQQVANPDIGGGAFGQGSNVGFRGYQQNLADLLQAQAQGTAPSISDIMFQQAADRNLRQQLALAAGQRGNLAGAQRLAQQQAGQFVADTAGEAAAGRLAEQRGAQGLLGQLAGQGRGQDIDVARANQLAALQQQQINQAGSLGSLGIQADLARINAGLPPQPSFTDQLLGAGLGAGQLYLQAQQMGGGGSSVPQTGPGTSGYTEALGSNLADVELANQGAGGGRTWVPTGPYGQGYWR